MPDKKIISMLGCGWFGLNLANALLAKGFTVKGSTTSADKLPLLKASGIEPCLINFSPGSEVYDPAFFDCDILWICIPPKVRSGNGNNFIAQIESIITHVVAHHIQQVVFISSTGVYGDLNKEVNELSECIPDSESGKVLLQAEELLKQQTSFHTTIIRFAGLIGPGRDLGRFLAGKKAIANGKAPVNLVHLTDCVGINCAIMDQDAFGHTYNVCSPSHPSRAEFYVNAASRLGLELPEFITEKKNWKIVNSINTDTILNYSYKIDDLMKWLSQ